MSVGRDRNGEQRAMRAYHSVSVIWASRGKNHRGWTAEGGRPHVASGVADGRFSRTRFCETEIKCSDQFFHYFAKDHEAFFDVPAPTATACCSSSAFIWCQACLA